MLMTIISYGTSWYSDPYCIDISQEEKSSPNLFLMYLPVGRMGIRLCI